jgi:hypothetical protein
MGGMWACTRTAPPLRLPPPLSHPGVLAAKGPAVHARVGAMVVGCPCGCLLPQVLHNHRADRGAAAQPARQVGHWGGVGGGSMVSRGASAA